MNTPVSFEIAKLLKEKGFHEKCTSFYDLISSNQIDDAPLGNYNLTKQSVSIPTIAEVVMWLYEKHGIWIIVDFKETDESFQYCCRLIHSDNLPRIFCNDGFNNPTEAYEAAILYTLNNLI